MLVMSHIAPLPVVVPCAATRRVAVTLHGPIALLSRCICMGAYTHHVAIALARGINTSIPYDTQDGELLNTLKQGRKTY